MNSTSNTRTHRSPTRTTEGRTTTTTHTADTSQSSPETAGHTRSNPESKTGHGPRQDRARQKEVDKRILEALTHGNKPTA